jgi:hypothetical protein
MKKQIVSLIQESIIKELSVKSITEGKYSDELNNTLNSLAIFGDVYVLELFQKIKEQKINNGRMRRLILYFIFNHPNLELFITINRTKIKPILQHVYGMRLSVYMTNALPCISNDVFNKNLFKYSKNNKVLLLKMFFFVMMGKPKADCINIKEL